MSQKLYQLLCHRLASLKSTFITRHYYFLEILIFKWIGEIVTHFIYNVVQIEIQTFMSLKNKQNDNETQEYL